MKPINENTYMVACCPKCFSKKYFEIKTGSDGLFSFARFSHYKCESCQAEFKDVEWLCAVSRDSVQELVQCGLNGSITQEEMVNEFRKLGIYLSRKIGSKK